MVLPGLSKYAKSTELLYDKKPEESRAMLEEAKTAFERSFAYSAAMLEARYNVARCKVLLEEDAGDDLRYVFEKNPLYCIKAVNDPDLADGQPEKVIETLRQERLEWIKERFKEMISDQEKAKTIIASVQKYDPEIYDRYATDDEHWLFDAMDLINKYKGFENPETISTPYLDLLQIVHEVNNVWGQLECYIYNIEDCLREAEANHERKLQEAKRQEEKKLQEARRIEYKARIAEARQKAEEKLREDRRKEKELQETRRKEEERLEKLASE